MNRRGIGNIVFHFLRELSCIENDNLYIIYVDDQAAERFIPKDIRFSIRVLRPKIYPIWEQIILPLSIAQDNLDILHCPGNSAPIFLPGQIKLVLSIMDVMYMFEKGRMPKSPSWYQRIGRAYLNYIVPIVAKRAAAITTISASSKKDILQYIDVPYKRISVIWLAADSSWTEPSVNNSSTSINAKFGLNQPFVLVLGATDPRKNTVNALKAFAQFKHASASKMQMAIVGLTAGGVASLKLLARELEVAESVVFAEFIMDSDLLALYAAANIFLYPSLYEGFGLPVLEAMISGTPVITTSCGSISEIAGDAALMVDPHDVDSIAAAIMEIALDKNLGEHLIELGKARAREFSWRVFTEKTLATYQSVMFK
jgi:glycosyltransferase involved in cell wall biosynthesis